MAAEPYVYDFPTFYVAADWVEAHCVIPDGFDKGDPLELADWQMWDLLNFYRVKPTAKLGQLAPAFHWRRSQIVRPQKAGKAPYTAAHICLEAVGPALFAGWSDGTEAYRCSSWGCSCGFAYAYAKGEAMGRPWPTPLIQITATSDDQTDNIYDALKPMIDNGPLTRLIPKTGEEFIRLPNDGEIAKVTSSATSRLGQRVTFCPQDETGIWTVQNKMVKVGETQRRGLAGMGGRAEETTNAWNPAEGSTAQRTDKARLTSGDIFQDFPQAPASLSFGDKRERRRILRYVYAGCPWVDLDAIDAEAMELMGVDPAQAERFFGNRLRAEGDVAFDTDEWAALALPELDVPDGAGIVIGVDGARFDDCVAMIATEVTTGHQWPLGIWTRPEDADDDYEHPQLEIDGAMVDAHERFHVWKSYVDPQYIDHLVALWKGRYGEKNVIEWYTNRPKAIAYALRSYRAAIKAGDVSHNGDARFAEHIGNARKKALNIYDEDRRPMWTITKEAAHSPKKIDAAMAGTISWEARGDCIASGWVPRRRSRIPASV